MSTTFHTDITSSASASATTFNAPLGEIDAGLVHTTVEYEKSGTGTTTVTTAGTWYAVSSWETSFTPEYAGQTFVVSYSLGIFYADTAGVFSARLRIVDASNVTIKDALLTARKESTLTGEYHAASGLRVWTAGPADVGVTRKAKLYVTHSSNGAVITTGSGHVTAMAHAGTAAPASSELSFTFGLNDAGSTMVVLELVATSGTSISKTDANSIGAVAGIAFGGPITGTGMAIAGGISLPSGSFGSAGTDWTLQDTGNATMFTATNVNTSGTLADPTTSPPSNWNGAYLTTTETAIRQAAYGTVAAGEGVFLTFPDWSGSVPANHTEIAMSSQPLVGSWLVAVQCWGGDYADDLAALPSGWTQDADTYGSGTYGGIDYAAECRIAHHDVTS